MLFFFLFLGKSKIYCAKCTKKCSGEVLRVTDKYFHKTCFQCTTCTKSLAAGGFFSKDNAYYCTADYQKLYGTKCAACKQYVEGEVVQTMGNTYHQKCFTCSRCTLPFQSGSKVCEFLTRKLFPLTENRICRLLILEKKFCARSVSSFPVKLSRCLIRTRHP